MREMKRGNKTEASYFICEKEVAFGGLVLYQKYCYKALDRVGLDMRTVDTCRNSCRQLLSNIPTYEQFNRLNHTKVYDSYSLSDYNFLLEKELELTVELEVSVQYTFQSSSWESGNTPIKWHSVESRLLK